MIYKFIKNTAKKSITFLKPLSDKGLKGWDEE